MKTLRRPIAMLLIVSSLNAWASDYREEALKDKANEYGDKFTSIWAPLGFTIGGGAATVAGGCWTLVAGLMADSSSRYGQLGTFDYAMLTAGGLMLTAGLTLVTVGIIKFVLRSHRLRAQYGD